MNEFEPGSQPKRTSQEYYAEQRLSLYRRQPTLDDVMNLLRLCLNEIETLRREIRKEERVR
jgi:hypothetical protein